MRRHWEAAHEELVAFLRDLIRIPSINPPDPPGPEMDAARFIAGVLRAEGLDPEVIESAPGRGNVTVRLRGDGTGGDGTGRHRRRRAAAAEPPRRRPGERSRRLDARPVRRRHRRRLRLGSGRRGHEADGGARDAGRAPARPPGAGGRPGSRPTTPSPACAATSSTPAPPTRRPAVARGPAGSRSTGPTRCAPLAPSTRRVACRWSWAGAASTRSRSPRRASRSSGSTSTAPGATAPCPATTMPRSWPRRRSVALPPPASRA